jgi:hypothetical protein
MRANPIHRRLLMGGLVLVVLGVVWLFNEQDELTAWATPGIGCC